MHLLRNSWSCGRITRRNDDHVVAAGLRGSRSVRGQRHVAGREAGHPSRVDVVFGRLTGTSAERRTTGRRPRRSRGQRARWRSPWLCPRSWPSSPSSPRGSWLAALLLGEVLSTSRATSRNHAVGVALARTPLRSYGSLARWRPKTCSTSRSSAHRGLGLGGVDHQLEEVVRRLRRPSRTRRAAASLPRRVPHAAASSLSVCWSDEVLSILSTSIRSGVSRA